MKKLPIIISMLAILLFVIQPAAAQIINSDTASNFTNQVGASAGFAPSTSSNLGYVISVIIQVALSLLALIFLILAIVAGFGWMTAAGNEDKISKAQDTLRSAIIGLIIVLAAWAITYFIFKYLPFSGSSTSIGAS
jgi:hypothetical protein